MGSKYKWNVNPFHDFMLGSILNDVNIAKKEYEPDIYTGLITVLNYAEVKEDCIPYMDFKIIKRGKRYRVLGKNLLSSLWLSGIFPDNPHHIAKRDEIIIDNVEYKFNNKTNKLTVRKLK